MGLCNICGATTPYQCKCPLCKSIRLKVHIFYCSSVCKVSDQAQHDLEMKELISTSQPTSSESECSSGAIVHTSWLGQNPENKTHKTNQRQSVDDIDKSSTSPIKNQPSTSEHPAPKKKANPKKKKDKVNLKDKKKIPSSEDLVAKAKIKTAKQLTYLFNKMRSKIGILEPITPTWYWVLEVEKNIENARSSRHKYRSQPKLADLTKAKATSKLSRIWLDCMEIVKEIEKLDPAYRITFKAIKPDREAFSRSGKHSYETSDLDEMVIDESESSQELSQGSKDSSQELSQGSRVSTTESVGSDTEVSVDCRVCKEPILIDSVKEFTACTLPNGQVHFAAHYECLGLYPVSSMERKVIKTCTKCPRHRAQ